MIGYSPGFAFIALIECKADALLIENKVNNITPMTEFEAMQGTRARTTAGVEGGGVGSIS